MRFIKLGGRRYGIFRRLAEEPGLAHAFATRPMDVGARLDADTALRSQRRARMAADLGLPAQRLLHCVQVHGTRIAVADDTTPGDRLEGADGVVTDTPGLPLMTFSADCPLVLVYEPGRRVLGMVHASWRCTVTRITERLVAKMVETCHADPSRMLAGIGPGAGPCCYEVKEDVYQAAADLDSRAALFASRNRRLYFDLWQANRRQLETAGVNGDRIEIAGICTMCRNDLFYSFRREGAGCGHFGLMAALASA